MTMCVEGTPVEHYPDLGLWVKREDLCCPGGPDFSKTRGVWAHIAKRPENVIGVLDTRHSQGGWAVARACQLLGKRCIEYYPDFKATRGQMGSVQRKCLDLGAQVWPLQAGRSAVLYHQAKKHLAEHSSSYMMPNALKLPEMVEETAAEVLRTPLPPVGDIIVSASSGTIAAGVIKGLIQKGWDGRVTIHMGYSRSVKAMDGYVRDLAGDWGNQIGVLYKDEGYAYADAARPGEEPPFPSNAHYDLKAFRWWVNEGRRMYRQALLWNIG